MEMKNQHQNCRDLVSVEMKITKQIKKCLGDEKKSKGKEKKI